MMEQSRMIRIAYVTILVAITIVTACGRTPPAKFYTLQPVQLSSLDRSMPRDVSLAVGPVEVPAAMDRAEIVTRDDGNEVSFSQYHRWAAPLRPSIASVIAQNIGTLLETERVTPFTRETIFRPTHRVVININRYDSQLAKEFLMDATWSIKDLNGNKPLLIRNSIIRETLVSASTYEGIVAAQSRALATLSEEIAQAVLEMVPEDK